MNMASLRIITDDVEKFATFYKLICGARALRYTPVFAELRTPSFTLAFGGTATLALFNAQGVLAPAQNRTVIIEFRVEDVDQEFERLKTHVREFVQEPTNDALGEQVSSIQGSRRKPGELLYPANPRSDSQSQCLSG